VENFKRKTVVMTVGTTIAALNGENSNIGSTTLGWEWINSPSINTRASA
jgi:hypothetical protein